MTRSQNTTYHQLADPEIILLRGINSTPKEALYFIFLVSIIVVESTHSSSEICIAHSSIIEKNNDMVPPKVHSNWFRWIGYLRVPLFWIASILASQMLLNNFDHIRSKFLPYAKFGLNKSVINDLDELPNPTIHIFSHDPLVIYVTSFITAAEAAMLMHLVYVYVYSSVAT